MEKKKRHSILKRAMAIALSLMLAFTGFQLTGLRAQAAEFNFDNCISDVIVNQSGYLKSMKVKIVPKEKYADAYGKIAVHSKESQYSFAINKRYLNTGQSDWTNVNDDDLKKDGLLAWSSGAEFRWTDWNSSTNDGSNVVNVEFSDNHINLNQDGTYYIYLWTRSSTYGIYPDVLLGTISAGNGKLISGGKEIEISAQITLDNQGATTAGTQTVAAASGAEMPTITPPTRTGYKFDGYFTDKNGNGTK